MVEVDEVDEVDEEEDEASSAAYASYCHLARWYLPGFFPFYLYHLQMLSSRFLVNV